ncbi:MAG: hypothetical protein HKN48_11590 [Flavobacteriaceae bacterium]|nr:hypothetical protein [Flavobacteriaceae bacterium]
MEMKKEYTNGDVTVVWKPGLCFHAKECIHGLPDVFKPKEKPWIQVDNATSDALIETIKKCPSGALTYYKNSEGPPKEKTMNSENIKAEVIENGPLIVQGTVEVTHTDGSTEVKKRSAAFCRCGKTGNNPFCDGSHNG